MCNSVLLQENEICGDIKYHCGISDLASVTNSVVNLVFEMGLADDHCREATIVEGDNTHVKSQTCPQISGLMRGICPPRIASQVLVTSISKCRQDRSLLMYSILREGVVMFTECIDMRSDDQMVNTRRYMNEDMTASV